MAEEPFEVWLARLEKKVDRIIARKRSKDSMQKLRLQQQNAYLRNQIKEMKNSMCRQDEYIDELEKFLKVERKNE